MNTTKRRHIVAPNNCTGCALCANICPKDSISMIWNENGFLIPNVNSTKCIECGLCSKFCIAMSFEPTIGDIKYAPDAYAAYHKHQITLENSSSGGVFSALAESVISRGGYVYGVVWRDKLTAVFSRAQNIEALAQMRGSKYTQALPGMIYRDVKEQIKTRPVLFVGTPCQVHALNKFLGKSNSNLLTIDIVCHGVPSRRVLENYIDESESQRRQEIHRVSFRNKNKGWHYYQVVRHYLDGTSESIAHSSDSFMKLFLCDAALNEACYHCPYAQIPRQGDITLGDYWAVEKYHPDFPIEQGISAVVTNSEKGKSALENCSHLLNIYPDSLSHIISGQPDSYIRQKRPIHSARNRTLQQLQQKLGLDAIYQDAELYVYAGPFRLRKNNYICRIIRKLIRLLTYR